MCMYLPLSVARHLLITTFNLISALFVTTASEGQLAIVMTRTTTETEVMEPLLGPFMPLSVIAANTHGLPSSTDNSLLSRPHSPDNPFSPRRKTKAKAHQTRTNPSAFIQTPHRIDHKNNRTISGYTYQIPIPTPKPDLDDLHVLNDKRFLNDLIAGMRLARRVGLREWEWTAGEPSPYPASSQTAINSDEDDNDFESDSTKVSYLKRQCAFTYTRSDDPVFKGRRAVISKRRRNKVVWMEGDFGGEVDYPEFVPLYFDDQV